MNRILTVLFLFLFSQTAYAEKASAILKGTTDPAISGKVEFETAEGGVTVKGTLSGISPGEHGFHVHENGSCADNGNAAGSHFNPDQHAHGLLEKDGLHASHAGDLGNITADESGNAVYEATVSPEILQEGKYNVIGRAVIVHEKKDDFGQPTGNAGGRIACGIIKKTA